MECKYLEEQQNIIQDLTSKLNIEKNKCSKLNKRMKVLEEHSAERDILLKCLESVIAEYVKGVAFKPGTISNRIYSEKNLLNFLQNVKNEKNIGYIGI